MSVPQEILVLVVRFDNNLKSYCPGTSS